MPAKPKAEEANPKQNREDLINFKMKAGLSREEAEEVVTAQEAHDKPDSK